MRVRRHEVKISNPEKPFFPERGLTKDDLVQYYVDVAPCALNHIRRRPFHMKRYPNGVEGDFFHQKRVPAHPDYVGEQFVRFPSGHSTVFAVVDNAAALAWVVNLGCIELHTWHSRVDDIERPDYMLIDLDPTTDDQWDDVLAIALVVREVLDELGLPGYPKTSAAFTLETMRDRVAAVGDLTADIWRRRCSLASRFAALEVTPPQESRSASLSGRSPRRPRRPAGSRR